MSTCQCMYAYIPYLIEHTYAYVYYTPIYSTLSYAYTLYTYYLTLVYIGDVDTPEVIWSSALRRHLVEMVDIHLGKRRGSV